MLLKQNTALIASYPVSADNPWPAGMSITPTIKILKTGGTIITGSGTTAFTWVATPGGVLFGGSIGILQVGWQPSDVDTLGSLGWYVTDGVSYWFPEAPDQVLAIADVGTVLPAVAAGTAGGVMINGTNNGAVTYADGMVISSSAGDALVLRNTGGGSNDAGLRCESTFAGWGARFVSVAQGAIDLQAASAISAALRINGGTGNAIKILSNNSCVLVNCANDVPIVVTTVGANKDAVQFNPSGSGWGLDATLSGAGGTDPWSVPLPGAYAAGEAGFILGTNLDVASSTLSTYAGGPVDSVVNDVGGNVGGIAGVTFPTNFGSLAITSAGRVAIQAALNRNTAATAFPFVMFSSADHITPVAGLAVTAQRSIDGGAFAPCTNTPTNVGLGDYAINLSASDLNGSWIVVLFTAVGADPTFAMLGTAT